MKYAIISGSSRHESQSIKIAKYIETEIKASKNETYLFSLADNPLPIWDEGLFGPSDKWKAVWTPVSEQFKSADAFVFVVPEWHGAVPSAVRNLLQIATHNEFGHKPALIVAVSAAVGGAYPISELRMAGYKNNRLCYIPEQMIIRNVGKTFNGPTMESDDDAYLRTRMTYSLKVLDQYAKALKPIRESGVIDHKTYPNGM